MEGWKQNRLIDILDTLIDYRGKTPNKVDCGIPLITAKIVKNGRIETPTEFLPIEDYNVWMVRGFPQSGDVVLTTEAPLGEVAQLKEGKIALAQRIVCLRGKNGALDNTYLKYFLMSNIGQSRLKARETGTTVTGIKQSELKEILIDYPNYETQQQIASILSSLDNKIELNRRINDNLEQQAQVLFKAWFVDFEPFGGQMPKDWEYKLVADFHHEIETGRRPKGGVSRILEGVPSIGAESIKGIGYYDYSKTKFIPEDYAQSMTKGQIKDFDLLIYKDGGKPGYFIPDFSIMGLGFPFSKMYLNEHVFRLNFGSPEINIFVYFFFRTDDVMNYLNSVGGKAAIPGINQKNVEDIRILDLNIPQIKTFGGIVLPMIKIILENSKESARLAELRDTLLPKLMSGELKINDLSC